MGRGPTFLGHSFSLPSQSMALMWVASFAHNSYIFHIHFSFWIGFKFIVAGLHISF